MTAIDGYLTERTLRLPWPAVNTFVSVMDGQMTESAGQRLRAYIDARWTRKQRGIVGLAKRMNVDTDTIYSWFRDERPPNLDHLEELAKALGVSRWEIVAAMDGEDQVVDLRREATLEILRQVVDAALDERRVPRRRSAPEADGA
jgi:transcriptional regulator with XRE-family HTH domain